MTPFNRIRKRHVGPLRPGVPLGVLYIVAIAACLSAASMTAAGIDTVRYRVEIDGSGRFAVHCVLPVTGADSTRVEFPSWAPGAYDVVRFGRFISDFSVEYGDRSKVPVVRSGENAFAFLCGEPRVRISYTVTPQDIGNLSPWFCVSSASPTLAVCNGFTLFGFTRGTMSMRHEVKVAVPQGWKLDVALPYSTRDSAFAARDYNELVDSPVLAGHFVSRSFAARHCTYAISVASLSPSVVPDVETLKEGTRSVVKAVNDFFGATPDKRYSFHFVYGPPDDPRIRKGAGALEHRASSTYLLPYRGREHDWSADLLTIAHEYFHAWLPKRVVPASLHAIDYRALPSLKSLWLIEGITEYYAHALCARSGLISTPYFLQILNNEIALYAGAPQPESIISLCARQWSASDRESVAMYGKGLVIGTLLDAEIRRQTMNRSSLDRAIRYLNRAFGGRRPFDDDSLVVLLERATGARLQSFYDRYINGTAPLPVAQLAATMAFHVDSSFQASITWGVAYVKTADGLIVGAQEPDLIGDAMPFRIGDTVTSVVMYGDTIRVAAFHGAFDREIPKLPGITSIGVQRHGQKLWLDARFPSRNVLRLQLAPDDSAPAAARAVRKGMFGF